MSQEVKASLKGTAIEAELNTDAYNLYDETGKLVSIGYCYECYGIIVNPDLVEQAGHKVEDIKNFERPPRRSSRGSSRRWAPSRSTWRTPRNPGR